MSDRSDSAGFSSPQFWVAAASIWTAAVLALACSPNAKGDWLTQTFGDKALHAFAFAVGGVLWIRAVAVMGNFRLGRAIVLGSVSSLFVGAAIEIVQMYVPTRQADILDFGADIAGVLLALAYLGIAAIVRPTHRAVTS